MAYARGIGSHRLFWFSITNADIQGLTDAIEDAADYCIKKCGSRCDLHIMLGKEIKENRPR